MFEDTRTGRPWGYFRQLCLNTGPCTVKMMFVKTGERLSLQYHHKRDQLYFIIDPGFTILNSAHRDFEPIEFDDVEPGSIFIAKRGCQHRAIYNGNRKYGRFLDVALGENDETDIVRVKDKYNRKAEWFDVDPVT